MVRLATSTSREGHAVHERSVAARHWKGALFGGRSNSPISPLKLSRADADAVVVEWGSASSGLGAALFEDTEERREYGT